MSNYSWSTSTAVRTYVTFTYLLVYLFIKYLFFVVFLRENFEYMFTSGYKIDP